LPQINTYQNLVNYLNELNAVWVNAMKRMSPQLLIQQVKATGPQYIEYLRMLDPFKPVKYSVAWRGAIIKLVIFFLQNPIAAGLSTQ
jgi:hypothetical protein